MFNGELRVLIYGDDAKDAERLDTAIAVLTEIADAFSKMGSPNETEIEILRGACHTLDEVRRGEYF